MSQGGPVNVAMGKNDPTNAGYDQLLPSLDQTNAGYNHPGQNQPPQPGYYQPVGINTVIVQNRVIAPQNYLILACLSWFCCPLIGCVAIILSCVSLNAVDSGDMQQARSMGRASMWTSIAGVIVGIIGGINLVIIVATRGGLAYHEDCNDIYDEFC